MEWLQTKRLPPKSLVKQYEESANGAVIEDVGYWRKANQIHNWFVMNVQNGEDDCSCYEVSKERLEDLLECCKIVKNKCKLINGKVKTGERLENGEWVAEYEDGQVLDNHEIAAEYLPTQRGFFFGSTDYDEWYLRDIEDTIKIIEKVLDETDFDNQVIYYSSSW